MLLRTSVVRDSCLCVLLHGCGITYPVQVGTLALFLVLAFVNIHFLMLLCVSLVDVWPHFSGASLRVDYRVSALAYF